MVEPHLAKVVVAGSNPVSRSNGVVPKRLREQPAKLPSAGSIPAGASIYLWVVSSVG